MEALLAEKAFEALQVSAIGCLIHSLQLKRVSLVAMPQSMCTCLKPAPCKSNTAVQAERESTEFRIKAIGKALEYKHLEVLALGAWLLAAYAHSYPLLQYSASLTALLH